MATATLTAKQETPFEISPITYPVDKAELQKLSTEYLELIVTSVDDKEGIAEVRDARLKFKNARIAVENRRKELKSSALEYGRQVDSEAKAITAIIEPVEHHLAYQEGIVKREQERIAKEAEEKRQAITRERLRLLQECGGFIAYLACDVERWTDEGFAKVLERERSEKKARDEQAAAAKLEQERIYAEQRDAQLKMAEERRELDRIKAEQAAAQAKIDAENKRIEDEKAAQQRAIELEKARAEAAEKARLDAIAEQERKEREAKAAEAELKRLESLRPDHEKLLAVAVAIEAIEVPKVSKESQAHAKYIREAIQYAANDVRSYCEGLMSAKK